MKINFGENAERLVKKGQGHRKKEEVVVGIGEEIHTRCE